MDKKESAPKIQWHKSNVIIPFDSTRNPKFEKQIITKLQYIHAEQMFLYYLINIWKKQNRLSKTLSHFARLAHLRVFIWKIFISPTISHKNLCKNYWDSLIIMKKSWKMFDLLEDSQNPSPWFNVVQVCKSYAGQWRPGMNKQTCNRHRIRRQGVESHSFCDWLSLKLKKK